MKKKRSLLSKEDIAMFRHAMQGTRRLEQDTVCQSRERPMFKQRCQLQQQKQQAVHNSFYFSDEFQPLLQDEGPIRFLRSNTDPWQLKKLRRGNYVPELFLDLHGLTQQQAKQELAALISACLREHIHCACVMHGHGRQVLKQQVPLWLAQHPDILAFHQAPKIWGGSAALLLLVETTTIYP